MDVPAGPNNDQQGVPAAGNVADEPEIGAIGAGDGPDVNPVDVFPPVGAQLAYFWRNELVRVQPGMNTRRLDPRSLVCTIGPGGDAPRDHGDLFVFRREAFGHGGPAINQGFMPGGLGQPQAGGPNPNAVDGENDEDVDDEGGHGHGGADEANDEDDLVYGIQHLFSSSDEDE